MQTTTTPPPLRTPCPPGVCACKREQLAHATPAAQRILWLTASEEKKMLARVEAVTSWDELRRVIANIEKQVGIVLKIAPSHRGVRTVLGFRITLAEQLGLCRKTQKSLPAAVRKCMRTHPEIAYAILNEHSLLSAQAEVELDIDFDFTDTGEATPPATSAD